MGLNDRFVLCSIGDVGYGKLTSVTYQILYAWNEAQRGKSHRVNVPISSKVFVNYWSRKMGRWYVSTLAFHFDQALIIVLIFILNLSMESCAVATYRSGIGRDGGLGAMMMGCNSSFSVRLVTRQRLTVEDCWEGSRSESSVLLTQGGSE